MKQLGIMSTTALFLILGIAPPAKARQEEQDKPKNQEKQRAKPERQAQPQADKHQQAGGQQDQHRQQRQLQDKSARQEHRGHTCASRTNLEFSPVALERSGID